MGGSAASGARLPGRDVGQEHRGQHPDPHHLRELPALPPQRQDRRRCRGRRRATWRSSRSSSVAAAIVIFLGVYGYFVEATRAHRASRSRRCCRCCSRWSSVTVIDVFLFRNAQTTGEPRWGQIAADLAVRADLHRRHLHLADGPDGLRALGPAPALARLRRDARHLGRRLHADARASPPRSSR